MPERGTKVILTVIVFVVAGKYILQFLIGDL